MSGQSAPSPSPLKPSGERLAAAGMTRRGLFRCAGAVLAMMVSPVGMAGTSRMVAARVWPAEEYTRVTLESAADVKFTSMVLRGPDRLVVDLQDVTLDSVLRSLPEKVLKDDPLVQRIRVGDFRPGVVRIVFDLKTEVKPQLFMLKPIANYGHRLVVDIYPANPPDPLLALIEKFSPTDAAEGGKGRDAPPSGKKGGKQPPTRAKRFYTIVVDAGHGGEDPGAVGSRGTHEKQVALAIARILQKKIDARSDMRAVLTRKGDYFVPLHQRVALARRAKADLFVSVHADAFVRPDASGSSVYVLSERGASSTAAKWLAQKENDADLIGGVNIAAQDGHLARTLLDLSQTATINDSLKLGGAVLTELGGLNRLHKPKVEQAAFAVLRSPDIPSILVETAFISNPQEELRLKDRAYQEKMADAILRGIQAYLRNSPVVSRTTVAMAKDL